MPISTATARNATRATRAPTSSTKPAPTAPTLPPAPETLTPWRSLAALAESLNEGSDTPTFSRHGIRHYVYQAEAGNEPDLMPFVRRIGRKLVISEPGFLHWLETRPTTRKR
jgi:hypothetical protein